MARTSIRPAGVPIILAALLVASLARPAASATYTWAGGGSAAWNAAASWNPARATPDPSDVLQFNSGGSVTATAVPTETDAQLLISNGTTVNLQAAAAVTLTLGGGAGVDLDVPAGCALNCNAANAITIMLGAGATASISGSMTFSNAGHRFNANDAAAITFNSGAVVTQGASYAGNLFTNAGTANVATFASGSTFIFTSGANPFGLTAPNSKVVFQAGSLFSHQSASSPSLSNRTYANFEVTGGVTVPIATSFTGTWTADRVEIKAGNQLNFTHASGSGTGTLKFNGDLIVDGQFTFLSNLSQAYAVKLSGASTQAIKGAGTLTLGSSMSVEQQNTTTVLLQRSLAVACPTTITNGTFEVAGAITSASNLTVKGTLQMDTGGSLDAPPIYTSTAALVYNPASPMNVGPEWGSVAPNVPPKVTVNSASITMPASDRTCPGDLTINATFLMNAGGGDLYVGGNWSMPSGGTFTANGRAVHLNGAGAQSITLGPSVPLSFFDVFFDFPGGTVSLLSPGIEAVNQCQISRPVTGGGNLTADNLLQINDGGSLTGSPTYGSIAQLRYSVPSGHAVGDEWGPGTSVGIGVPSGVTHFAGALTMPSSDRTDPGALNLVGGGLIMNAGGGDLYLGGDWNDASGSFTPNGRAVHFNGAGTQTISKPSTESFFDVFFDVSLNPVVLGAPVTVANNATVSRPVTLGSNALTVNGTLQLNDGASLSNKPTYGPAATLVLNKTSAYTVGNEWGPVPGPVGVPINVTVQAGSSTVSMPSGSRSVPGALLLASGTLKLGGTLTANGNATISAGAVLLHNTFQLTFLGSTLTNNGSISAPLSGGGPFGLSFSGTLNQLYQGSGDTGTDLDPLLSITINKTAGTLTIDPGSLIRVNHVSLFRGNVINSNRLRIGSQTAAPASIQIGNGLPSSSIGGSFDVTPDYSNLGSGGLTILYLYEGAARATGAEVPPSRQLSDMIASNLHGFTISGGSIEVFNTALQDGALAMAAGNRLKVTSGGTIQQSASGNFASGAAGGLVEFLGTGTVSGTLDFNDVTLDGGLVDFGTGSTVHGTLTIAGAPAPYARVTRAGAASVPPVLLALRETREGETIERAAPAASRRPAAPEGVGGSTPPSYAPGSTLKYATSYNVAGEWVNGASGPGVPYNVEVASGTLDFNPNASSTSRTARGGVSIDAAGELKLGSSPGGDLVVQGDWSRAGTFTPGGRNVILGGTSAQNVTGASSFADLTMNNSAGVSLGADVTVDGTLTLTSGNITTGANKVVISSTGSVSRTSGHVVGTLQKRVAVGGGNGAASFEIGDASHFTPVDFTGTGLAQPFDLAAATTPGDHPGIGSSGLDPSKSVNRYYTMTRGAIDPMGTYDLVFHFDPADVDAGADPSAFLVGKHDAVWTRPTVGTRTATSIEASGMTSFSDFQIAEGAARTLTLTIVGNGSVTRTPNQGSYADGTIVRLDPVPGAGWSFSAWSGDATGSANPLFVTMDADKNITATFVDVQAPSVQVLAPNGGEVLTIGSSFNITWNATDNDAVTTVDLAYSTNGGATFPNAIATGIANSGNYSWTVPNDPSVAARVRVTAHDAAANAGFDDSNANFTIQALVVNNTVNAVSPSECLSTAHACVTVPVTIARDNAVGMRAYSVTITLSPELDLCAGPASITESTYLNSIAGTGFVVTSLGGNAYRVDGSIIGPVCGATAASGTLFNVSVKPTGGDGTGTVTLGPVVLRDCSNSDLPSSVGTAASVSIDHSAPATVGSLAATQQLSGNDTDGTTKIALTYTAPGDAVSIEVYRKGFGFYPEYDDAGGAPPTPPSYPPAGWTPVAGATLSGVTDEPATRDFWTYAVFAKDACGNVSAVSITGGTLNYFLGDVSDGHTAGAGNNSVAAEDISLLGANYGIGEADITARGVGYLDVGPTTDLQASSRPTTDDRIDFEDLIVFAVNYGQVSSPQRAARVAGAAAAAATGPEQFTLRVPALVEPGQVVSAELRLEGAGRLQGFSAKLGWDPTVVEPLEMHSGQFIEAQHGVVLTPRPGTVDASLLGVRERGISGAGTVATVSFRVLRAGDAAIRLAQVIARDAANRTPGNDAVQQSTEAALPTVVELLPPMPNPARGPATLVLAQPHAGPIELAVYSVDGRRVRTLVNETRAAGIYRIEWDGRDEARNGVAPGVYYAHLSAGGRRITRSMVRLR